MLSHCRNPSGQWAAEQHGKYVSLSSPPQTVTCASYKTLLVLAHEGKNSKAKPLLPGVRRGKRTLLLGMEILIVISNAASQLQGKKNMFSSYLYLANLRNT